MKFTTQVQNPSVFNGLLEVGRCEYQGAITSLYEAAVLNVKRDKVSPRIARLISKSFNESGDVESIFLSVGKRELIALANAAALKGLFAVDFPEDFDLMPEKNHWTDGLAESYAPDSPMVLRNTPHSLVEVESVKAISPTGEPVL